MKNTQPKEKSLYREDGHLDIVQVWRTIQGEGPFSGMPAVFVRLAGCNLDCPACDTDYTSGRRMFSPRSVLEMTDLLSKKTEYMSTDLVVFTGGEPFRQNITPTVNGLLCAGYDVQIETNGTLWLDSFGRVHDRFYNLTVVCSPKTPEINATAYRNADIWKYIVSHGQVDDKDGLPIATLGNTVGVARPHKDVNPRDIYIQPLDEGDEEKNRLNLEVAVSSCLKFGYRLSLQIHKYIGLE